MQTVGQLAAELGVTPRTIRFYEDAGLLAPARQGTQRVYDARDRARLLLILRGKRLGFSLRTIAEYLDLYRTGQTNEAQLQLLLEAVGQRLAELEEQRRAVDQTIAELEEIGRQAVSQARQETAA